MSVTQVQEVKVTRKSTRSKDTHSRSSHVSSIIELIVCVGGIYVSFLTWALLQERISTTPYGPDQRIFRSSLVINTIQSLIASLVGYFYLTYKRSQGSSKAPVFGSWATVKGYTIVAFAQSLSSPFAYASLAYVDYLTLLLAKSCKLLPVMALQLTVYRRRFPSYKYFVVGAITLGVCMFTYYHPSTAKKAASSTGSFTHYGMLLLGINLFLDGFYNSTQDDMFHKNKEITGPHMMCGLNAISTVLTTFCLLTPLSNQLGEAVEMIALHPRILGDIILFGICGGLGQVFIYHTLARYGSMILVTVTVTRKMFSMLLSVVWFNHTLSLGQWAGVLTVFGGIGAEAYIKYAEKKRVQMAKSS